MKDCNIEADCSFVDRRLRSKSKIFLRLHFLSLIFFFLYQDNKVSLKQNPGLSQPGQCPLMFCSIAPNRQQSKQIYQTSVTGPTTIKTDLSNKCDRADNNQNRFIKQV